MDILVKVSSNRKCPASIDWDDKRSLWVLSFGDLESPDTDVEVDFLPSQLTELRGILIGLNIAGANKVVSDKPKKVIPATSQVHKGSC